MADKDEAETGFWDDVKKLFSDLLAAFLIFLALVFVAGELYTMHFMRAGNELMLWLPVAVLVAALFYKALE